VTVKSKNESKFQESEQTCSNKFLGFSKIAHLKIP